MENVLIETYSSELFDLYEALNESCYALLEAVDKTGEAKVIGKEIKDAAKEKDKNKLIASIKKFKKWLLVPEAPGEERKPKLKSALLIFDLIFNITLAYVSGFLFGTNLGNTNGVSIGWLIAEGIAIIGSISNLYAMGTAMDKEQDKAYTKEYIESYKKKIKKLQKQIDSYKGDKSSVEYKKIIQLRDKSQEFCDFMESHRKQLDKQQYIKDSKKDLKDAKKSKDADRIAKAKENYKFAKTLKEAAELLNDDASIIDE